MMVITERKKVVDIYPMETEDHRWCAVRVYEDGKDETPYTFPTKERALHYCKTIMEEQTKEDT